MNAHYYQKAKGLKYPSKIDLGIWGHNCTELLFSAGALETLRTDQGIQPRNQHRSHRLHCSSDRLAEHLGTFPSDLGAVRVGCANAMETGE